MKIHLISILFLLFLLTQCQKGGDNYKSEGVITGADLRDCACCGGWFINIDTVQYEFDSLPENSKIDLMIEVFPIYVKLDWQFSEKTPCTDNRIIITRIIKK
jgi:hypothetical protein